jgi:hypothetical protein
MDYSFKAFKGMYVKVKLCVICNYARSEYIYIHRTVGLKQGYLASPISFCIFKDKLERCLSVNDIRGIELHPDRFQMFIDVCRRHSYNIRYCKRCTKFDMCVTTQSVGTLI